MKDFELQYIPTKIIEFDPETPNIRGKIHDTTELQPSIKRDGIQDPLDVRLGEDGNYYLMDGARRLTAARLVGLEVVPCIIKDVAPEDVYKLMLISDIKQPLPHIIMKDGKVVGGKCLAVVRELERGLKKFQLAEIMGIRPDIVGAYDSLYSDAPFVQERVAKGDIDITVYSLMKRMPLKFKDYLLTKKKGPITASLVRRTIKDWKSIEARLDAEQAKEEASDDLDDLFEDEDLRETAEPEEELPVARCLNEARQWVAKAAGRGLTQVDRHILLALLKDLEDLQNG